MAFNMIILLTTAKFIFCTCLLLTPDVNIQGATWISPRHFIPKISQIGLLASPLKPDPPVVFPISGNRNSIFLTAQATTPNWFLSLSHLYIQFVGFIFKIYSESKHFLPPQSKPPSSFPCITSLAFTELLLPPTNYFWHSSQKLLDLSQILSSSTENSQWLPSHQSKGQSHYYDQQHPTLSATCSILTLITFLIIHVVPFTMVTVPHQSHSWTGSALLPESHISSSVPFFRSLFKTHLVNFSKFSTQTLLFYILLPWGFFSSLTLITI